MDTAPQVPFPCEAIPEDPAQTRLLGLYSQRQAGLLMQRIKVLGGRIAPAQLRGLALLARRYSGERLLHLTTRQDIELHSLRPQDVPAVQRAVHEIGLTTVGACGDTVRNITVCPHNGFRRGTWDLGGLAQAIYAEVEQIPWIRQLPRKFKISLSSCPERCARPWTNDIGLAANGDGTIQAVLAGSLGSRPNTGLLAYPALQTDDVLALVRAVLQVFFEEGDRRVRSRARLRHVRERLGDQVFCGRIDQAFRAARAQPGPPPPAIPHVQADTPLQAHLRFPLGDLEPEIAEELAAAAAAAGSQLRIGLNHDLLLFGTSPLRLPPAVDQFGCGPTLVACPGATWCSKGIVNSREAARRIRQALPNDCRLSIQVSGCPNNCALAAVADVGLIGRIRHGSDGRVECFHLLVGGGLGQEAGLGRELHPAVPARDADRAVAWLFDQYQQANQNGPLSWRKFVEREFGRLAATLCQWFGPGPAHRGSAA
ncbi:MAG: hypothetical protein ACUVUC_14685 [Thermoguttaceae bacterium]